MSVRVSVRCIGEIGNVVVCEGRGRQDVVDETVGMRVRRGAGSGSGSVSLRLGWLGVGSGVG